MREACSQALARAGTENAHFRPESEMNAHKLTLGVRDAFVDAFSAQVSAACAGQGLKAKVITSGTGGWRYIDVVSAGAGKLESLEYVRGLLGFSRSATVAAGDSGNDVAMLSGRNRAIVVGNAQPDLAAWAAQACGLDGGERCASAESSPEPPAPPLLRAGGGGMSNERPEEAVFDVEATSVSASRPVDEPTPAEAPAESLMAAAAAPAVALAEPPAAAAGAEEGEEEVVEGARLYRASASQAWGVIEGLQHFGFA